jgi:hypothetical protein
VASPPYKDDSKFQSRPVEVSTERAPLTHLLGSGETGEFFPSFRRDTKRIRKVQQKRNDSSFALLKQTGKKETKKVETAVSSSSSKQ